MLTGPIRLLGQRHTCSLSHTYRWHSDKQEVPIQANTRSGATHCATEGLVLNFRDLSFIMRILFQVFSVIDKLNQAFAETPHDRCDM
jgi:hypothetical protein